MRRRRSDFVGLSFAALSAVLLHTLMILPLVIGGTSRFPHRFHSAGVAAGTTDASDEPAMLLILIDPTKAKADAKNPPKEVPLPDLGPDSLQIDTNFPNVNVVFDLPGANNGASEIPSESSPPTETVALFPYGENGDRIGEMVSAAEVIRACRSAHPGELTRGNHQVEVDLRVFVLPDGRIAQGEVTGSSGNEKFDRAVFQCVQAYANVTPLIVDDQPVGSWQTVKTHW